MAKRDNFAENFKSKFDYDVSNIGAYTDEKSMDIWNALIKSSNLLSRFNLMAGVKSSTKVKLANFNEVIIQDASNCSRTPDGGVVFYDTTLAVAPFKVQEEYCNKDLNGKWTEMYNKLGANAQDLENPFEDVIIASKTKTLLNTLQRISILGDTASLDANLSKFDGVVKLVGNDANVIEATMPGTSDLADIEAVAEAIPEELFANGVNVEVWCSRTKAKACLKDLATEYNYNGAYPSTLDRETGSISFELPTIGVVVRSIPEFSEAGNTNKVMAIPYDHVVRGVDGEGDEEQFSMEYNNAFKVVDLEVEFKFGLTIVQPEYFVNGVSA